MESVAVVRDNIQPQPDLIAECRKGDRAAMRSIYVEHQRRVYSIALNFFGGDASKADDVTQQVFLKIFTRSNFRGDSDFTTWLYRMTVNACIDETRKGRRYFGLSDLFTSAEPRSRDSLDERMRSKEVTREVQLVLGSLKPKYRIPLLLKYIEELSYREIANVLDCSIGTVSSRLSRGHKILAAKLQHLKGDVS